MLIVLIETMQNWLTDYILAHKVRMLYGGGSIK